MVWESEAKGVLTTEAMSIQYGTVSYTEGVKYRCQMLLFCQSEVWLILDIWCYLVEEGADIIESHGEACLLRHPTHGQGELITAQSHMMQGQLHRNLQSLHPLH